MNFITNKCECYWEEVDVIVVNLLATPRMYIQSHLQQRSWKSHLFRIGKLFSLLLCQKKKTCNGSHCVSAWLGHRTQANRNNSSECFPAASFGCEWDLQSGLSTNSGWASSNHLKTWTKDWPSLSKKEFCNQGYPI